MAVDDPTLPAPATQPTRTPEPSAAVGQATPQRPMPRRRVSSSASELTAADAATMAGCAVSALALTWLVFTRLTGGTGWFAFLLVAYVTFLALFALVTADRVNGLVAVDRLATVAITVGAVTLLTPLLSLVGYVIYRGLPTLRLDFFLEDQRGVTATMPATAGGGQHAIVGTLQQVGLALVMTVPLSLATAVFLNETRSRLRRPVRIFVDAMSGLPSIVAGLFIYAVLILPYARSSDLFDFNGFMASLALSMIMLPTVTRTIEVVLRLVPDGLREASLALGASRARTVWSVVLPTARSGMTTAIVLGIARAVGETAPLLFTAFGYDLYNANPFETQQESLPLFVFKNARQPNEAQIDRGFAGALVLLIVVLSLFAIARFVGRDRSHRTARRGRAGTPTPPWTAGQEAATP